MSKYADLTLDQLNAELAKTKSLLEDAQHERDFLGRQSGQHINATEFQRIDRDIERYGEAITELEGLIAQKG